ncbi:MAG: hypothetical protein ABJC90_04825 [Roseobacter sp.]
MLSAHPLCGQSYLMRVQQIPADPPNQDSQSFAALQRDFPKPDIQIVQFGQTPIQTFAVLGMSV